MPAPARGAIARRGLVTRLTDEQTRPSRGTGSTNEWRSEVDNYMSARPPAGRPFAGADQVTGAARNRRALASSPCSPSSSGTRHPPPLQFHCATVQFQQATRTRARRVQTPPAQMPTNASQQPEDSAGSGRDSGPPATRRRWVSGPRAVSPPQRGALHRPSAPTAGAEPPQPSPPPPCALGARAPLCRTGRLHIRQLPDCTAGPAAAAVPFQVSRPQQGITMTHIRRGGHRPACDRADHPTPAPGSWRGKHPSRIIKPRRARREGTARTR